MKLSRTFAYALQATLQLAMADEAGVPIPCSRLAVEGGMPGRFLPQILRGLVAQGILRSTRGVEGGYSLKRSPADISLLDVIEAVDGPLHSTPSAHSGLPEQSKSKLQCALQALDELVRRELRAVKLAHLLPSSDDCKAD